MNRRRFLGLLGGFAAISAVYPPFLAKKERSIADCFGVPPSKLADFSKGFTVNSDLVDDSIVDLLPQIRAECAFAMSREHERLLINGA